VTTEKIQTTKSENNEEHDEQVNVRGSGKDSNQEKPQKEKVNIATFRGIPKKLHETIKSIAADLGISPGELARYFLENGLARISNGEEEIQPSFVPGGYTLYPDERRQRTRRKATRKSKALQKPRSYYGVPREVVKAVLDQSKAIGVTQGELARYLFELGIERFKSGQLTLKPVPVQQIATLYPNDLG
jgi:hypothetical protein